MSQSIRILMIGFLILMPLPAAGQETVKLEPVVVTASRIKEPLSKVSSAITVITAEDIEIQQAVTVEEVLRNVPGLDVQTQGSIGEQTIVRLRGAEVEHTLVLIDGVKVNSPFFAFYDFGDLLADNIERIEIVRGAQSALYGSEAIGGVINIITKRGKGKNKFTVLSEGGNNNTFRELAAVRGGADAFDYSLSGSRTDSEGEISNDGFWENSFSGQLNIGKPNGNSLQLITRYLDSEKELYIDIVQSGLDEFQLLYDKNRLFKRKLLTNSIAFQQDLNPWWDVIVHGSVVNSEVIENNPDTGDVGINGIPLNNIEQSFDCTQRVMEIQNNYQISELDILSLGFQAQSEKTSILITLPGTEGTPFKLGRTISAIFLQNSFNWRDTLFINAGLRFDDYSDFGNSVNPKISASYRLDKTQTKIRGGFGTGFRAPTYRELYAPPPMGNLDLTSEKSKNYELGLAQELWRKQIKLSITSFWISFHDLISPPPFENTESARSRGIEVELKLSPIDNLAIEANYTYLDTQDESTGEDLPRRPRHRWNTSVNYSFLERIDLRMDLSGMSSQREALSIIGLDRESLGYRNSGYFRLDFTATYKLLKDYGMIDELQLFGKCDNLLDEEYFEVMGFPAPGFTFLAGLKVVL